MRTTVLVLLLMASPAGARDQVVLKLGTLAPQGSAWHEILREMGRDWEEVSGGTVKLKIYAGGTQGGEGDMIRKLGIGQLQAAALTNVGMHDLVPQPKALSTPLFFATEAEADCALQRVRPTIEAALAQRGFAVVHWSQLGALYLFCNAPRRTPAEMAQAGFFAQEGDDAAADAWRVAGFRPVQLSATDLYPALATGMIDCVPSLPVYVLTARLHEKAGHMMDLAWGHMYGATVVRRDVWERISPELRSRLLELARSRGEAADAEVRRLNADALSAMRRQGLTVTAVDAEPWRAAMARAHPLLRGHVVPEPFYDELVRARAACRDPARVAPARR
jgi:TRAP-type C4-dicarboxylate transport system substrate-binding protein